MTKLKSNMSNLNQESRNIDSMARRTKADIMILKNRIALLKRETNKSQRKVVETQKRTDMVHRVKSENLERKARIMRSQIQRAKNQAKLAKCVASNKDEIEMSKKRILLQKQKDVQSQKKLRQKNLEAIRQQRAIERMKAARTKHAMKEALEYRKKRENIEERTKLEKIRQGKEQRINEERESLRDQELLMANLEAEELALIEGLQRSQQQQKQAYKELEGILRTGLDE